MLCNSHSTAHVSVSEVGRRNSAQGDAHSSDSVPYFVFQFGAGQPGLATFAGRPTIENELSRFSRQKGLILNETGRGCSLFPRHNDVNPTSKN